MTLHWIKKCFAALACLTVSVFATFGLTAGNVALAQPVFQDGLDVGLTSLYSSAADQDQKIQALKTIGFDLALPLSVADLNPAKLGDGLFQSADLDFTSAVPSIPGTNTRISFSGPIKRSERGVSSTGFLFAVVAGKPKVSTCPVEVQDTQIAFFDNKKAADQKANELANQQYLVYVTGNKEVQRKASAAIRALNCQPNAAGIIVNGKTQQVTIDFSKVANLLPPKFQQPAKNGPFVYKPGPKSDAIYLVNARKIYKPAAS